MMTCVAFPMLLNCQLQELELDGEDRRVMPFIVKVSFVLNCKVKFQAESSNAAHEVPFTNGVV